MQTHHEKSTHVDTNEARAGRVTPYMRYVLAASTLLAVIVLLFVFGVFSL